MVIHLVCKRLYNAQFSIAIVVFNKCSIFYCVFRPLSALIVQWLGHLVVAEKTWVRFPLGAHNTSFDEIG